MKTDHDDSPTEDRALTESPRSPAACDIGELFLAELQARRERLRHWIGLLSEEAGLSGGPFPAVHGSHLKCRARGLPSRAARRLGTRRHSTVD
jgi:hypothetical protein